MYARVTNNTGAKGERAVDGERETGRRGRWEMRLRGERERGRGKRRESWRGRSEEKGNGADNGS